MLSRHFSEKEFMCRCKCKIVNVDEDLLTVLEMVRDRASALSGKDFKMNVLSGCRCKEHNDKVGGEPGSFHLTSKTRKCKAADIEYRTGEQGRILLEAAIYCRVPGIGVASTYIHLDTGHKKNTMWGY